MSAASSKIVNYKLTKKINRFDLFVSFYEITLRIVNTTFHSIKYAREKTEKYNNFISVITAG